MKNLSDIKSTKDIEICKDPFERVIGQDYAVNIAKICIKQKRHLLLVGPPGVGKSMIARSISFHIPKPTEQISVVNNRNNIDRPYAIIEKIDSMNKKEKANKNKIEKIVTPVEIPFYIAENLGFRCRNCGTLSEPDEKICKKCGTPKEEIQFNILEKYNGLKQWAINVSNKPKTTLSVKEKDKIKIYSIVKVDEKWMIKVTLKDIRKDHNNREQKKVIVPINRNPFVMVSGASETEILGDVKHDPYGGDFHIGTPAYLRVIPGAIHLAHQGVLFIDELGILTENLQISLLTAMQNKKFPIVGKNSTSSGASVYVDNVPCDFIFVAATNIMNLPLIHPALRSRIRGYGYEILLNTYMPDNEENRYKIAKFIAQEIHDDGKIPHANIDAIYEIINLCKNKCLKEEGVNGLSLKLRDIGGIIRLAGDIAVMENSEFIEKEHVIRAMELGKPLENQLKDKYGSIFAGMGGDYTIEKNNKDRMFG